MNTVSDAMLRNDDVHALMQRLGRDAVAAAAQLALATTEQKNRALAAAAADLRANAARILEANAADMQAARNAGLGAALLDRLQLDAKRVEAMARGLEDIVALSDPVGSVIAEAWVDDHGGILAQGQVRASAVEHDRPADAELQERGRRHRHAHPGELGVPMIAALFELSEKDQRLHRPHPLADPRQQERLGGAEPDLVEGLRVVGE